VVLIEPSYRGAMGLRNSVARMLRDGSRNNEASRAVRSLWLTKTVPQLGIFAQLIPPVDCLDSGMYCMVTDECASVSKPRPLSHPCLSSFLEAGGPRKALCTSSLTQSSILRKPDLPSQETFSVLVVGLLADNHRD
jgi:hypothetical protein